jgi:hypothetical protein
LLKVSLNTITLTLYSVHSTRIQALEWNPQGKRKRGRPKNSWHRGIISELQVINTTWGEAKRKDHDRTRWKETVVALCPPMGWSGISQVHKNLIANYIMYIEILLYKGAIVIVIMWE